MKRERPRVNLARRVDVNMGVPRHYPKFTRLVVIPIEEVRRRIRARLIAEGRLVGYGSIDTDEASL
jgi:hypothetical protein